MSRRFRPAVVLAVLGLSFGFAARAAETAVVKARTILILDVSGSMAARIDGRTKIAIAREAVRELINGLDPQIELGFMAYGHRRKGDCTDIELLIPPDRSDPAKVLELLPKLQPLGMTPYCASVKQAAETLEFTEQKASIILVSDGVETCGGDPTALGKMLHEKGIDFKAHIIGFDLGNGEDAGLRSLAKETGGKYFAAGDAASLKTSLNSAMREVAATAGTATPPPAAAPGIRARAFDKEGGEPIAKDMRWDLNLPGTGETEGERVTVLYDAEPLFEVPPGKYILTAQHGEAKASKALELGPDGLRVDIILGAGRVRLTPVMSEGGAPIEKDIRWQVFTAAEAPEDRRLLTTTYDPIGDFSLPAGSYVIVLTRGDAVVEKSVIITPGQIEQLTVVLGAGTLAPTPYMVAGGPVVEKDTTWEVFGPENAEGERKQVCTVYDATPRLALTAGDYLLRLTRGLAKKDIPLTVKAGETQRVDVVLQAGILRGKAPAGSTDPTWEIFQAGTDSDGIAELRRLGTSYDIDQRFILPAGDYVLRLSIGDKKAEQPVTIQPGKVTDAQLQL